MSRNSTTLTTQPNPTNPTNPTQPTQPLSNFNNNSSSSKPTKRMKDKGIDEDAAEGRTAQKNRGVSVWGEAWGLVRMKNVPLTFRKPALTATQILSPFFFLLTLYLLQRLQSNGGGGASPVANPVLQSLPFASLPSCPRTSSSPSSSSSPCVVLLFSPNDSVVVRSIATRIATSNDPTLLLQSDTNDFDIGFVSNEAEGDQFVVLNPGSTLATISFLSPELDTQRDNFTFTISLNSSLSNDLYYSLFDQQDSSSSSTSTQSLMSPSLLVTERGVTTNIVAPQEEGNGVPTPFPVVFTESSGWQIVSTTSEVEQSQWLIGGSILLSVQRSIIQEIATLRNQSSSSSLDIQYNQVRSSGFPTPNLTSSVSQDNNESGNGGSLAGSLGGVWFYCPAMLNLIVFTHVLMVEKEKRLRQGLSLMGMREGCYCVSWLVTFAVIVFLHSLVFQLAGYFVFHNQFPFISSSNFFISFFAYFLFSFSLAPASCLFSTLLSSSSTATSVSFLLFIVGFFIQGDHSVTMT